MNRGNLILVMLLCLACMGLGIAFGAEIFGCDQDQYGADHVFLKAHDCWQSHGPDGSVFLDCRHVVRAGGAK